MLISSRPCRRPTSKSLKSCAGVIFTAPLPFSGSEYASATIGRPLPPGGAPVAPPDERQHGVPADEVAVAVVVGVDRDAGVAEHRLGTRGRDDDEAPGLAL